ncbi:type II toxin-antitoxin system RelE/ParE family toxin [Botrimarina sp.]|uniref:type II toxin-antitoxin system RelE/ParE family toxin n=1 Tax=Botrimarina sp. TaxID=2795802 RepID=UPI0032EB31CB
MRYRVRVTLRAKAAIDEQIGYIANMRQSPTNALRVLEAIEQSIDSLATMPERGALAPEDAYVDYSVRMLIIMRVYLLLYRIDESGGTVVVVGFRHGSRLPRPGDLGE